MQKEQSPLLQVENVSKSFKGSAAFKALNQVSFTLYPSETLGIVGESGSGKTTISKIIAGIFPASTGRVLYQGEELPFRRSRDLRREIQYIYQEPVAALDPKMTVERILAEPLRLYYGYDRKTCRPLILELLENVGLPAQVMKAHPRQLSGGQCQRIGIARAMAGKPKIILCDEPTSALDATIQIQILELMKRLKEEKGFSYIFITHNLGVVQEVSSRILVMNKGEIVESGMTREVFAHPRHAYTRMLLESVPKVDIPRFELVNRDVDRP